MKSIQFKTLTLYIQFSGQAPMKRAVSLPFYPKAWRKHPAYDGALNDAISCAALYAGLSTNDKPVAYSLLSA